MAICWSALGLAILLYFPAMTTPAQAGTVDWQQRLREVDAQLKGGAWESARMASGALLAEMLDSLEEGPRTGSLLAFAVLQRALARAALGEKEEALWDWSMAQNLDDAFRHVDLSGYGPAADLLDSQRIPDGAAGHQPKSVEDALQAPLPPGRHRVVVRNPGAGRTGDPQPPKAIAKPKPECPKALRASGKSGTVVVSAKIDETGRVRSPLVTRSTDGPLMAFAALEALRNWRFQPSTFEGEPVEVSYLSTFNFSCGGGR